MPLCKTGALEKRYGVKWVIFYLFSPGPRPGYIKECLNDKRKHGDRSTGHVDERAWLEWSQQ